MIGESLFEVIADIVSTTEPLSCKPIYGYMSKSAVQCNTLYEVYFVLTILNERAYLTFKSLYLKGHRFILVRL